MAHEINLFEIPDRRLLTDDGKTRANMRTDIGVAKVTRTIFGTTKVRVIREQDKARRTGLLAALFVIGVATAVWQGWTAYHQAELLASQQLPLNARMQVSAPAFQPEYPSVPASSTLLKSNSKISATTVRPVDAKPIASKPQAKLLAENSNSPIKKRANVQPSPKLSLPIQPVRPVTNNSMPQAARPAAKEIAAVEPAASGDQPAAAVGVQSPQH